MNKIINLKERVKEMMSNENVSSKDIENALEELKDESVPFSDIPRNEQIDYFINKVSCHEFEDEIADMLSTLAAYNNTIHKNIADHPLYESYFDLDVEELRDLLNNSIMDADDVDEEEKAWNLILDTLGESKVFQCIDDYSLRDKYLNKKREIEDIREKMFHLIANEII